MHARVRSLALSVVIALVVTACGGGGSKGAGTTEVAPRISGRAGGAPTITVDFATPVPNQAPMTGLFLGLGDTNPPDSVVAPLHPQLLRAWPDVVPYSRAAALDAPYVEVIAGEWGYPSQDWKGKGPPWANFTEWEDFVRQIANEFRGRNVVFDIWNEPNSPLTWEGTFPQFFETFQRAANVIRSELGDSAMIAGPETNIYDPYYMTAFMQAAKQANLRVDVLTWHEEQDPDKIQSIETDLDDARSRWTDNPDYANVGVKQLGVYQTIGLASRYAPGDAAATFYYLEAGKAGAGVRGCWPEDNGLSSCTDATMGMLLTQNSFQPRSSWWAYKLYADGVASRVASATTDPMSIALASSSVGSNAAQVLVGRTDAATSSAKVTVPIDLNGLKQVPFLANAANLVVKARLLPNSGADALPEPQSAGQQTVPVTNGTASVQVDIAAHEVVVLTITAA